MNLEIKTDEATFGLADRPPHFYIDCACGGKDGVYSGSRLSGADIATEMGIDSTTRSRGTPTNHTFYLQDFSFKMLLETQDVGACSKFAIECRDCGREFSFTLESYRNLIESMKRASSEASGRQT